jgi:hypothetical protein
LAQWSACAPGPAKGICPGIIHIDGANDFCHAQTTAPPSTISLPDQKPHIPGLWWYPAHTGERPVAGSPPAAPSQMANLAISRHCGFNHTAALISSIFSTVIQQKMQQAGSGQYL